MAPKRFILDTEQRNMDRTGLYIKAFAKQLATNPHLDVIESIYQRYRFLANEVDKDFSAQPNQASLVNYAVRMRVCLDHLTQLESDIASLRSGGRISLPHTIAAMAHLAGEMEGMKYTVESRT